jgi:hypothetical protein
LVESVIDHALELFLSFDLFVENPKSYVFYESQVVKLTIHVHLLTYDIDQEILLLLISSVGI